MFSAIADPSELSIGGDGVDSDGTADPEKIRKIKEELKGKVAQRQREKDLEELYGLIDGPSDDEEAERVADIKELNEPYNFFKNKMSSSHHRSRYYQSSERYRDLEMEAAERERAARRRQQTQEFMDNIIEASLSVGKQSAFLFAKMVNYSAKYPVTLYNLYIYNHIIMFRLLLALLLS